MRFRSVGRIFRPAEVTFNSGPWLAGLRNFHCGAVSGYAIVSPMRQAGETRRLCTNRRARHDYLIEEVIEAGIALTGTEVKSLREGRADMKDSYAAIEGGEAYLFNCHISPYAAGNRFNPDPNRKRKLLLHREEIARLFGKVREKGLTLVPLSFYTARRKIKIELALARGKKLYDKREVLKERAMAREMAQLARGRADRE